MNDIINQCANTIRVAAEHKTPLRIRGSGSKDFYGNNIKGNNSDILSATTYTGIVNRISNYCSHWNPSSRS